VLLERIRVEKEQLIKEGKIKRDKHESVIYRGSDNSYYEIRDGIKDCIDEELPFDIPTSWEWVRLETLSENIHYGFTASASQTGNSKLLRITDIQDNSVQWDSVPFCNPSEREYSVYGIHNRDIMIARTGGTIGKSYIVRDLADRSVFASYLIRCIPLSLANEEYLKVFFETPLYWGQLRSYSMGTGQPNVNGQSLKSLLLPLPPIDEQLRIVATSHKYMERVDRLSF
jgi:type I restriction enzyme S subunit